MTQSELHSITTTRSYSTDVEGGAPVMVRMRIAGSFEANYLGFVAGRAEWLSLSGWAANLAPGRAEVVAAGPEALVGALEMACLLGPLDTLIETLETEAIAGPVMPGFAIRA
jgi:acylphosphatase